MKIVKRIFLVLLLISSMCIISCGGGGSDDDPKPYVEFSGGDWGDNEWILGFTDPGYDEVPIGCYAEYWFEGIALNATRAMSGFSKNSVDHIYIETTGIEKRTYVHYESQVLIRVNSGSQIELNDTSVVLSKVTNNYVKGTFTGVTSGKTIKGSFVFKRLPDDTIQLYSALMI